ncbi:hypothetical protein LINPERHAP1_LOCUS35846, partial [Linum perenne]
MCAVTLLQTDDHEDHAFMPMQHPWITSLSFCYEIERC